MEGNEKKIVIIPKKEGSQNQTSHSSEGNVKEKSNNNGEQESFGELFEQSMAGLNQGEIISGKVASIQHDEVFVDVGYKSEGKISISEFDKDVQIDDAVKVMVVKMEDEEGNLVLSKKNADSIICQKLIEKSAKENTLLQGKVIKEIKGGFIVDLGGIDAFLPGSQVDIKRVISAKVYIGKKFDFKIIKYEPEKKNVILSRKLFLEEELNQRKNAFFNKIKEGDIVKGKIKSILDYGVFVELIDGMDGFVHLKEVSWNHIKNCNELLSVGDQVKAKVLKVDLEQKKINLGLKQLTEDPWESFFKEHKSSDVVQGEVMRLAEFGVFVKVSDGVEGLLHVTEISWTKRIRHPKEVLKVGDRIKAMILEIDPKNHKFALSLRQILPNPWDDIDEIYPKGKKVQGKIKNITNFGAFIELDDELTGLLRSDDVDWTKKTTDLKKEGSLKKGSTIDVIVLDTNKKEKTISLGLKQLLENPWEIFKANHPKGTLIKRKIIKVTETGLFIDVESDLEGFIHASEMLKKRDDKVKDLYTKGDQVECVVTKIDIKKKQIFLSIKQYAKQAELNILKKYSQEGSDDKKITLGDLIDFGKIEK